MGFKGMAKDKTAPELDHELTDLPQELRWREWMRQIEAVLFFLRVSSDKQ